jgi:hypothetical protein
MAATKKETNQPQDPLKFTIEKWGNFVKFLKESGPEKLQPKLAIMTALPLEVQLSIWSKFLHNTYDPKLRKSDEEKALTAEYRKKLKECCNKWNEAYSETSTLSAAEKVEAIRCAQLPEVLDHAKTVLAEMLKLTGPDKTSLTKWVNDRLKMGTKVEDNALRMETIYKVIRYMDLFCDLFHIPTLENVTFSNPIKK